MSPRALFARGRAAVIPILKLEPDKAGRLPAPQRSQ